MENIENVEKVEDNKCNKRYAIQRGGILKTSPMFAPSKSNIGLVFLVVCFLEVFVVEVLSSFLEVLLFEGVCWVGSRLACLARDGAILILVALGKVRWRGKAHLIGNLANREF